MKRTTLGQGSLTICRHRMPLECAELKTPQVSITYWLRWCYRLCDQFTGLSRAGLSIPLTPLTLVDSSHPLRRWASLHGSLATVIGCPLKAQRYGERKEGENSLVACAVGISSSLLLGTTLASDWHGHNPFLNYIASILHLQLPILVALAGKGARYTWPGKHNRPTSLGC